MTRSARIARLVVAAPRVLDLHWYMPPGGHGRYFSRTIARKDASQLVAINAIGGARTTGKSVTLDRIARQYGMTGHLSLIRRGDVSFLIYDPYEDDRPPPAAFPLTVGGTGEVDWRPEGTIPEDFYTF